MAHQCGTSGRQVGSNGRSEVVGATLRGEPGAGGRSGRGSGRGSPYNTPPLDEHQLDGEESEIGQKGIEPKVKVQMWRGAPGFLVWNSITFSGVWLRFSEYSQVFPSIP